MSIADHTAILLYSGLAAPERNKLKAADAPLEYYAVVAFEPSAAADLAATMLSVSPSGTLDNLQLAPKLNKDNKKPYPGIPDDWITVRMSSRFAPNLYAADSEAIAANPLNLGRIQAEFFSGQRVRVDAKPFAWFYKATGTRGISLGLQGLMAVGGGTVRPGAGSAAVFGITPGEAAAAAQPVSAPVSVAVPAPAAAGNPFQVGGAPKANPFG